MLAKPLTREEKIKLVKLIREKHPNRTAGYTFNEILDAFWESFSGNEENPEEDPFFAALEKKRDFTPC